MSDSKGTRSNRPSVHRHGVSHALATLLTTIISGTLVAYYQEERLQALTSALHRVSSWAVTTFDISLTTDTLTIILVASVLSLAWGVAFHWTH